MCNESGKSTLENEMHSPEFRKAFEKEYSTLEVSEFIAERMSTLNISVRKLAEQSGVSPTVIQGIKSGKRKNIEYTTLKPIVRALGCQIDFVPLK